MRYEIVFFTDGLKFSGDSLEKGQPLGGSETALLQLAKEVAKKHEVVVFCNCSNEGTFDGVLYLSNKKITKWSKVSECDIFIAHRFMDIFQFQITSKLRILWNHDILTEPTRILALSYNIDYMYCATNYHREQYINVCKEIAPIIKILPNGIDFNLIPKPTEKKHKIMFTSRPERGLFKALELYEELGDKTLEFLACSYSSIGGQDIQQLEKFCMDKISELKQRGFNISYASFSKPDLYKNISESKAVFYPTDFPEIFCIGAVEAQACGTPFISIDKYALKETVGYQGCKTKNSELLKRLSDTISGDNSEIIKKGKDHVKKYNYQDIAKKFISDADNHFEKRSQNKQDVFERLIYESDLVNARKYAKENGIDTTKIDHDLRFVDGKDSLKELYENEDTFEKIDIKPEEFRKNGRFKWLADNIGKYKIPTLLDFACHSGWATLLTGNENPTCKALGYDLSSKAIEIGKSRKNTYDINKNVEFTDKEPIDQKFDALFAGEYLEHVLDPEAEVDRLEKFVNKGGKMFITIPKGAWEWLSRLENKKLDVFYHVHGFEKRDVMAMFQKKKDFGCKVIDVGTGGCGEALGNYLIEYTVDGTKTGKRDLKAKTRLLRPYQTISACIIAKDAEKDIENMLSSIVDEADEIIVGIDKATTDNTIERCKKYGAKIIELPNTIGTPDYWGFSNARNHVVSHATGKWILWIDTDERLFRNERMRKFLNGNLLNAFVIKQHHPELDSFIEADKPHRLYRAGKGKFFGYVHEQPMAEINKPIEPSLIMGQANIIHFGAITEHSRKQKALSRNLKLLEIDLRENPTRKLSKILLMRDLVNRMKWAAGKFGTTKTKDALQHSYPLIKKIYEKHFRNEKDLIYKDLADVQLQEAMRLLEDGYEISYNFTLSKENSQGEMLKPQKIRLTETDIDDFAKTITKNIKEAIKKQNPMI